MDLRTIAIISLYIINLSVFIIQQSVYCTVRTGSSNQTNTLSSLQCYVSAVNNQVEISVFHMCENSDCGISGFGPCGPVGVY